jgi:rod shape-determining protein MreC
VNSANFLSGGIYSLRSNITSYFNLKAENQLLVDENAQLRMQIERFEYNLELSLGETSLDSNYRVIAAKLINNSYSKTKNRLTIDKGSKSKISLDMGVITSDGIVGIVDNVSRNYATVQSILNTNSQINAKLKKSNHFGSLVWDTSDPNVVQLIDVPMLAAVEVGDTIVTGGRSTIFPEGIPIGTVNQVQLDQDGNFFDLDIILFNDMTSLGHVYVIENLNSEEIKQLESEEGHVEE